MSIVLQKFVKQVKEVNKDNLFKHKKKQNKAKPTSVLDRFLPKKMNKR